MPRHKTILNEEEIEKLASRFWTKLEIAAFFDVHVDTITNNYQSIYEKGREKGKSLLRDTQLKAAQNGNVTMLIWLGKQYLNQTEKLPEVEQTKRGYDILFEVRSENNAS